MSLSMGIARDATQGAAGPGLDQGGFFDFLGDVAKGVVGGITGGVPGALGAFTSRSRANKQRKAAQRAQRQARRAPQLRLAGTGGIGQTFAPPSISQIARGNFASAFQIPAAAAAAANGAVGVACPKGFHSNKSSYFTQAGFVAKGTRCVKDRRRNALNPRALTAAVGRVRSAKTANRILSRITIRSSCPQKKHK